MSLEAEIFGDFDSPVKDMMRLKKTTFVMGIVESVDSENGTMSVSFWKFGKQVLDNIRINFGTFGPSSGLRVMPKRGDSVLLGFDVTSRPFHLGTYSFQYHNLVDKYFETSSEFKMQHVKPGEFHLAACKLVGKGAHPQGSIYGDNNGNIQIKGGDLSEVMLDAENKELYKRTETERYKGFKARVTTGVVKRKMLTSRGIEEEVPRTYYGVPIEAPGIDPLSETRVKIGQETGSTGEDEGEPAVEVVFSEQVLDEDGLPVFDSNFKPVQIVIKTKNGSTIFINEDGEISFNKGQNLLPPKQKAARENDAITIPVGPGVVDTEHPGISQKGITNMSSFSKLAGMFFTNGVPAQFIPTGNTTISGEITEGSSSVLVGG